MPAPPPPVTCYNIISISEKESKQGEIPNASEAIDGYEWALSLIRLGEMLFNLLKNRHSSDEVTIPDMRHAEYTTFHVGLR
jgi:hypothetical protein